MLLVRPKPVLGESFMGYLYRLAKVNGLNYEGLVLLFKGEAAPLKTYDVDDRTRIKTKSYKLTGYKLDMFDPWMFYIGYRDLFDYKKIKICPECFAENPVYLAKWHSRFSFVCKHHNRFLIDECSCCSKTLVENSFIRGECESCETPISAMMSQNLEEFVIEPDIKILIDETTRGINLPEHQIFVKHLEFYIYLVSKDAYLKWDKRRDANAELLSNIVNKALFFMHNFNAAKQAMLVMYCLQDGLGVISNGLFSRFLKSNERPEYKLLFKAVVEEYAENRGDETVRVSFLALLYDIDVKRLCSTAEVLDIALVSKQGGKFLRLSDLQKLIKKMKS